METNPPLLLYLRFFIPFCFRCRSAKTQAFRGHSASMDLPDPAKSVVPPHPVMQGVSVEGMNHHIFILNCKRSRAVANDSRMKVGIRLNGCSKRPNLLGKNWCVDRSALWGRSNGQVGRKKPSQRTRRKIGKVRSSKMTTTPWKWMTTSLGNSAKADATQRWLPTHFQQNLRFDRTQLEI